MNVGRHVEEMFAHYLALCKLDGWRPYAWRRVNDMAKECPELYGELPARITKTMKELNEQRPHTHDRNA